MDLADLEPNPLSANLFNEGNTQMSYVMPKVTVGQVVYWRHSLTSPPAPAIVTEVYHDKLDCVVIISNARYVLPKSAVRHMVDPCLPTLSQEAAGDGVWELTERDKMIDGVLRELYGKTK